MLSKKEYNLNGKTSQCRTAVAGVDDVAYLSPDTEVLDTVFSKLAALQHQGLLNKIVQLETLLSQLDSELALFLSSQVKNKTE